jgi:hypothetical protein
MFHLISRKDNSLSRNDRFSISSRYAINNRDISNIRDVNNNRDDGSSKEPATAETPATVGMPSAARMLDIVWEPSIARRLAIGEPAKKERKPAKADTPIRDVANSKDASFSTDKSNSKKTMREANRNKTIGNNRVDISSRDI